MVSIDNSHELFDQVQARHAEMLTVGVRVVERYLGQPQEDRLAQPDPLTIDLEFLSAESALVAARRILNGQTFGE